MTSHCGKTSASCITCSGAALGEWDIPVGGMGSVTAALAAAAAGHGAEITTGANVYTIDPNGAVRDRSGDDEHLIRGRFILAGVTPVVLAGLLGEPATRLAQGAQVKVTWCCGGCPACATTG